MTPLGIPLWNRHLGTQIMLIDPEDHASLPRHRFYLMPDGYAMTYLYSPAPHPRTRSAHRLIMGDPPHRGMVIDHINRSRVDNRRQNLRWVTPRENGFNAPTLGTSMRNTSGVIGVTAPTAWRDTDLPFMAQIGVDLKSIYLGRFATLEEAAAARREAEVHYWGKEWVAS